MLAVNFLLLGAVLFSIGVFGVLARRNAVMVLMSVELILNAVNLNLVAFARYHANLQGQIFVLFILAVAACEAGVALALFISLYRRRRSLDSSDWQDLRELGVPPATDEEPLEEVQVEPDPVLTPAGARPQPTAEEAARV